MESPSCDKKEPFFESGGGQISIFEDNLFASRLKNNYSKLKNQFLRSQLLAKEIIKNKIEFSFHANLPNQTKTKRRGEISPCFYAPIVFNFHTNQPILRFCFIQKSRFIAFCYFLRKFSIHGAILEKVHDEQLP